MQKEKVYSERLKFYADTQKEKNKYFCFEVTVLSVKEAIWRFFSKGWTIRAMWYEKINLSTGEIVENSKLNIQSMFEEWYDEQLSAKK